MKEEIKIYFNGYKNIHIGAKIKIFNYENGDRSFKIDWYNIVENDVFIRKGSYDKFFYCEKTLKNRIKKIAIYEYEKLNKK